MDKIIIEVGSTNTKIDKYDGKNLEKIENIVIEFKKNYKKENKLNENDIDTLIEKVNSVKEISTNIYVCGTSIFRNLEEGEKEWFLNYFESQTGYSFNIISPLEENELTVIGATRFLNGKAGVMIGGGGSTEISIYDKQIIESVNSPIGVIDVTEVFPDLAQDIATTSLDTVKSYIKERIKLPKEKADILILAGGEHETFARKSGINYEENTLYNDSLSPIMMDIKTRIEDTKRYFQDISLDEIRSRVSNPEWWYGTRAMTAFVLVVAEAIEAKYIIPTNIALVYGIVSTKF